MLNRLHLSYRNMTSDQIITRFKDSGNWGKLSETLELITITFLLGNEYEHLSFEMRREVVDCYYRLKWLLSEIDNKRCHFEPYPEK